MDVVGEAPLTVYDGAHNPSGAHALAGSLDSVLGDRRPRVAVIGVLDDKDAAEMLRTLLPAFDSVVLTRSRNPRSLPPATLLSLAEKVAQDVPAETVGDPQRRRGPRAPARRSRRSGGGHGLDLPGGRPAEREPPSPGVGALMRVFVAGGSGVVGSRLIPALLEAGHEVSAGTRSEARAPGIRALGAEPVVADALDREAIVGAVVDARPDAVIHQLTAIPARLNPRHPDRDFALTNRLRSEGTDNLLAAARAARAGRFLAQSFAGWPFAREGGPVKEEDAPLTTDVPAKLVPLLEAIRHLETVVPAAEDLEGIVLRYGFFYGSGTSVAPDGAVVADVRKRRMPIVAEGAGVWSFVHLDDVAAATVAALERGRRGIYHVVDDEPAPVAEWLPALAEAAGARRAAPGPGVAGAPRGRRARGGDAERDPGCLQRQGPPRAGLGAAPSVVAPGLPRGARRGRRRLIARTA